MKKTNNTKRTSFARIKGVLRMPHLLDLQVESFDKFLQKSLKTSRKENSGLHQVFHNTFPIFDSREKYCLEYIDYVVGQPKYTVRQCQQIGATYNAPLKVKLRLSSKSEGSQDFDQTLEQETYFGTLPVMTPKGTFIINGAERVIVTQLHRSPGVFFSSKVHPNGTTLFSSKIIPFRGSWLEFETTIADVIQVYIDRRKKFPVTIFLRAMGFSTDEEIFNLFDLSEDLKLTKKDSKSFIDKILFEDIDLMGKTEESGSEVTKAIIMPKGTKLTLEKIKILLDYKVKKLSLVKGDSRLKFNLIYNTLAKDITTNQDEALLYLYEQLRMTEAPDVETARKHFDRLFFDDKRYNLGEVGRYRIDQKMDLNFDAVITYLKKLDSEKELIFEDGGELIKVSKILKELEKPEEDTSRKEIYDKLTAKFIDSTVITRLDTVLILKELLEIKNGKKISDDIDHLGNRRVKTVGEQLANQFGIALSRMSRTIREKMVLSKNEENLMISDLINIKTISSVINAFFGTNQLSQFMDQINPLAEITNKRRLSALGAGGLTRDRAGFEVRDVHYTHYGRLCPIETPEGPNIGLISSLATYAKINHMGFIETPYRKVIDGKVTKQIDYLTADEEDRKTIAQANEPLTEDGSFKNRNMIQCRQRGDVNLFNSPSVDYMDCNPLQVISAAAALIPFLDHDDANRALMGSNMQRQAVPLLVTDAPLVGTGMEERVAKDSKAMIISDYDGVVKQVDANGCCILLDTPLPDGTEEKNYTFTKFFRTNQNTCVNNIPIIREGQEIKAGDVLADGPATDGGELALGKNMLVAYMSWKGYNFEDAIILNERIVKEDIFTSIHIQEHDITVKETKRGEEELTCEIPNVSEDSTKDLDTTGIIRVGAEVKPGDILVGKVTPKGEVNLTPEDKLLKAIFGEKAGEVKDASLRVPPGDKGIVINTKVFARKRKDSSRKEQDKQLQKELKIEFEQQLKVLNQKRAKELLNQIGTESVISEIYCVESGKKKEIAKSGEKLTLKALMDLSLQNTNFVTNWTSSDDTNLQISEIIAKYSMAFDQLNVDYQRDRQKLLYGDELPPGILQMVKIYVAKKRKIQIGDKMAGRHGNKGIVSRIVPVEDLPYLEDGTSVDIILNPLGVPSRMNPGQIFETNLGWAARKLGDKYATPVFDGATIKDVKQKLKEAKLPSSGKSTLYDGMTGEKFDQEVTVGYTYMLKLAHLVEDKLHARSIGPYSLITQQPLGGKAQFGGQRFGEMEVWALEAYGASHILQEMLTYKSDDVVGRTKVYESIVKGQYMPNPGIPESFNVLVRELQGLGLDVKLE